MLVSGSRDVPQPLATGIDARFDRSRGTSCEPRLLPPANSNQVIAPATPAKVEIKQSDGDGATSEHDAGEHVASAALK